METSRWLKGLAKAHHKTLVSLANHPSCAENETHNKYNSARARTHAAQSPREPAAGSRTHVTTAYSGCRAGYPVQWAAYDNGHMPGPVDGTYGESGITTWTKGEIWRFFAQFS